MPIMNDNYITYNRFKDIQINSIDCFQLFRLTQIRSAVYQIHLINFEIVIFMHTAGR